MRRSITCHKIGHKLAEIWKWSRHLDVFLAVEMAGGGIGTETRWHWGVLSCSVVRGTVESIVKSMARSTHQLVENRNYSRPLDVFLAAQMAGRGVSTEMLALGNGVLSCSVVQGTVESIVKSIAREESYECVCFCA